MSAKATVITMTLCLMVRESVVTSSFEELDVVDRVNATPCNEPADFIRLLLSWALYSAWSDECFRCLVSFGVNNYIPFDVFFFGVSIKEFRWTTGVLSTTCCQGQDKLLVWNYSVGGNDRIRQHQWYYNKTTLICYNSESYGFHVTPLYEGRVEQYGTSGILLKNLSSNDTGEYTLYPKLSGEKSRNVQAILLTVLEPPIFNCKPTITILSNHLVSCSMKTCGKPHLLTEWRLEREQDPVGNDSHLILKSSWTGKLLFCCPYEPRIECLNGNKFEFCTPNYISSITYSTRAKDDIHTKNPTEMHTVNVPNPQDTTNFGPLQILFIIVLVVLLLVITMIIGAFLVVRYFRKRRMLVKTKHKNAIQAEECTKKRAPLQRPSEPTDRHSSGSGQNQDIQIINNINMDSNILGGMFNSYTALKTELMVLQEENRQLADRLYRYQCLPQLKDTERNYVMKPR